MKNFDVVFLQGAIDFLIELPTKDKEKIRFNIEKAQISNDPELFKKLNDNIWEFRTKYNQKQYRLFAFWDKKGSEETLVIATHGLVKKTQKTPKKEIKKAERLMNEYFES